MTPAPDPRRLIEALLFAAPEPLPLSRLEFLLEGTDLQGKPVAAWVAELKEEYERDGKAFTLLAGTGGFQLKTREEFAPWVKNLFVPRAAVRLSRAALETLAIVAYKQPITRMEIEAIRGVNVDGLVKNLLDRELIKIAGQKEVVGRPYLYRTSQRFLELFGLRSLAELPPLDPQEKPAIRTIRHTGDLKAPEAVPAPPPVAEEQPHEPEGPPKENRPA
jgi:segregation and condensation protein B